MFIQEKKIIIPLLMGFLLISIACSTSIPFLESAPESTPVEAVDQNTLETMVAAAVLEKVAQTLEAMPPTQTETPLPTETPMPSPTATEIPPTSTPTKVDYPETGSELLENDDGSLIYLDYTGAYKVKLPAGWLAIRPNGAEYDAAWLLPEASSPEIRHSLETMQSLDANLFRIFILDAQEGHYSEGFVSNIIILLDHQNNTTLEEAFAQSVLELPASIPGLVVISSNIEETSSGLPLGLIVAEWNLDDGTGQVIRIYQKQALFSIENRSLAISLTSTVDFKDQILQEFDLMIDSFELLD